MLGYSDYRNFEQVINKAKTACFNSGHRIEDHFGDITEMIEIGKGAQRAVSAVYMSPLRLLMAEILVREKTMKPCRECKKEISEQAFF